MIDGDHKQESVGELLNIGHFNIHLSFFATYLNLNLNSLLVKRQIDNPSPGAVTGGN